MGRPTAARVRTFGCGDFRHLATRIPMFQTGTLQETRARIMRQISKDSRTGQIVLVSTGMILALLSLSCKPAPHSYVEALTMLKGTDYWELNCSEYICAAKHHPDCVARNFWEKGCDGDTYVVQDSSLDHGNTRGKVTEVTRPRYVRVPQWVAS